MLAINWQNWNSLKWNSRPGRTTYVRSRRQPPDMKNHMTVMYHVIINDDIIGQCVCLRKDWIILRPRKVTHRVISKFKKPSRFFKIISITSTNRNQLGWFIIFEWNPSFVLLPVAAQWTWQGGWSRKVTSCADSSQKSSKLQIEGYELKVTEETPQSNHFKNCFVVNNDHVSLNVLS